MKLTRVVPGLFAAGLMLTACGGGEDDTVETSEPQSGSNASESEDSGEQGKILESGFGQPADKQNSQYVWVTALVENLTDHGGQTVTVSFNLLDKAGEVITTVEQVESFSVTGQKVALGTQADVGKGVEVASVQPTLLVEDDDTFDEFDTDLGSADASDIIEDEYVKGLWHTKFPYMNPTDEAVKDSRVGIICKGADGKVNGGTSFYPELIAPSGKIVMDTDVTVSSRPKSCTAYVAPGYF